MTEAPQATPTATTPIDADLVEARRKPLLYTAAALVVLLLGMLGMGIAIASGNHGLRDAHAGIGYLSVLVGIVASVLAYRHGKARGNLGTFMHAVSLPVLMLVQIGLAEMDLAMVHISVGIVILVDAIALATLSARRGK
ncbi:hypothetical protein ACQB6R_13685 [Propionibacteriaceae bacterium G1746]|uniref:hypothetical protein n=1 Tax=Aestuariimicrobium sp. G57 TaxID=3418485 RepID=UPI003C1809F6